jgi:hypothetical protein
MWAVNTETGEQSTGLELKSPPVSDGIAVAQGRVYVSTMDGKVQCFGRCAHHWTSRPAHCIGAAL